MDLNAITSNPLSSRVKQGRFYIATSTRITASLGSSIRATIENPATSGRIIVMVALVGVIAPDRMVVGDAYYNPDTGLPTTAYSAFQPNFTKSSPAEGVMRIDSGGTDLSGGTNLNLHVAMHQGRNQVELPGIIIPPNNTLGLNVPLGALESGDGTFGAYWYEDDI